MKWRRKTAAIDMKHDYATVTLCIPVCICGSAAGDQSTDGSEYDVTGSHVGEAQLSAERDRVQFLRVGDDDDWTRRSERHRAVDLARRRSASCLSHIANSHLEPELELLFCTRHGRVVR